MNKYLKKLLEINSRVFKYILELFLILLILDTLEKGLVLRVLHFPLIWLAGLVALSGVVNFWYNFEGITNRLKRSGFLEVVDEVFTFSLIFYLAILLMKEFKIAFVEKYLLGGLNWLLGLVVVSGALTALFGEKRQPEEKRKAGLLDYMFTLVLGVGGGFLIYLKTQELGRVSYLISGISGLLIVLLSVLILNEDDTVYSKPEIE